MCLICINLLEPEHDTALLHQIGHNLLLRLPLPLKQILLLFSHNTLLFHKLFALYCNPQSQNCCYYSKDVRYSHAQ